MKHCSKCKECKPATSEYFYPDKRMKLGFTSWCIECIRKREKTEKSREKSRARYRTEEYKAKTKERNAKNAEWRHAYYRNRRLNEPGYAEMRNQQSAEYRKTAAFKSKVGIYRERHKKIVSDKNRMYCRNRRTRLRNAKWELTNQQWQDAIEYFNGCCAVCGRQLKDLFGEHTVAMDHWIPLTSPDCPGTVPTNIVPLCHGIGGCNNSKHNNHPSFWLERKFGKQKAKIIEQRIQEYFSRLRAT